MTNYIIWLLVVILYSPIFWKLYQARWEIIDYTHAYFILPLSLWLVWRKRSALKVYLQQAYPGKDILSLSVLILGILLFIFGWRQDYLLFSTLSLVPLLVGLLSYLYGIGIVKLLSFPILYLLLLVPPPLGILDSVTLPMRYGISALAEIVLRVLNFPIQREGLLLTIGYTDIFMGQPCSGFRSLITMFSLVLVYVYINKGSMGKKIVLTSFIAPIALFGNLIRVLTLCLITFYYGEEAGQGFFHNFSGIVIFTITLLGLMGIESMLDRMKLFSISNNS